MCISSWGQPGIFNIGSTTLTSAFSQVEEFDIEKKNENKIREKSNEIKRMVLVVLRKKDRESRKEQ